LKGGDEGALGAALNLKDSAIVLLQDAVYLVRESPRLADESSKRAMYVLGVDADRRGIHDDSLKRLRSISYSELVDLMLSGAEVINL